MWLHSNKGYFSGFGLWTILAPSSSVMFHCLNIPLFTYPFFCWWTFGCFHSFGKKYALISLGYAVLYSTHVYTLEWHYGIVQLMLWWAWVNTDKQFSKVVVPITFSPVMYESSRCSTSLPALGIVSLFYCNQSGVFSGGFSLWF